MTLTDKVRALVHKDPAKARKALAALVRKALELTPSGIEQTPWKAMAAIEMSLPGQYEALQAVESLWTKMDTNPAFQEALYALQSFADFCSTGSEEDAIETAESVELAFSYVYGDLLYDPGLLKLLER